MRTAATKGRSFRRRCSAQWRRSTLKSSSDPTASEGSSFYQSAGLLRGLSRGSIAVADWRKTGSVSAERLSHSYGSPQSASCCESYAFKRDVRGQTLSEWFSLLHDEAGQWSFEGWIPRERRTLGLAPDWARRPEWQSRS